MPSPSSSQPGSEDDDPAAQPTGEPDLGERAPAPSHGDHHFAGGGDCEVPRLADAGDDRVVDPLVGVVMPLARKDPDCRSSRRLGAAGRARHHFSAAAGDDGATSLREQPPDLLGALLVLRATPDYGHLYAHSAMLEGHQ